MAVARLGSPWRVRVLAPASSFPLLQLPVLVLQPHASAEDDYCGPIANTRESTTGPTYVKNCERSADLDRSSNRVWRSNNGPSLDIRLTATNTSPQVRFGRLRDDIVLGSSTTSPQLFNNTSYATSLRRTPVEVRCFCVTPVIMHRNAPADLGNALVWSAIIIQPFVLRLLTALKMSYENAKTSRAVHKDRGGTPRDATGDGGTRQKAVPRTGEPMCLVNHRFGRGCCL